MQLVHDGDPGAFEVVFDRHGDAAFSLAYRMCGRRAMAEDVVQEAFVSLWRSGARYDRARGSVRSWVLSVVHNRAIDAFRRDAARTSRDVPDEGLAERMIFRELYPRGLTAVDDIDDIALGTRPTMSHVTARLEMQNLLGCILLGDVRSNAALAVSSRMMG